MATIPDHLIELGDGWSLWRSAVLRSAGFPATDVLRLASPDAAAAADAIDDAPLAAARQTAIAECRALSRGAEGRDKKNLARALKQLLAGNSPSVVTEPAAARDCIARVLEIEAHMQAQREALERTLAIESLRVGGELRALAERPLFMEALLWQNRRAIATAVNPLLASAPGATGHDARHLESFVANYVQRYALKNDTIGFFGPIAWADLSDASAHAAIAAGPGLLAERGTYFEFWAIDALANFLARDAALRRHLPPRRLPAFHLDGTTLHLPRGRTSELPEAFARLLLAATGGPTAVELAAAFAGTAGIESEAEVYEMLEELADKRLLVWRPEIPTAGEHPERSLRAALDRVPESDEKRRALGLLDELEAARDAVARSAGDVARLGPALDTLDATFERITGRDSARNAGGMYAARSLVYEDTRRDVRVEIGRPVLEQLAAPTALMLESARWYTHEAGRAHRALFDSIHTGLCEARGRDEIDFLDFLDVVLPELGDQFTVSKTMRPVVDRLHAIWGELLGVTAAETSRVQRSSAQLHAAVFERFQAPGPGWPGARYHTPDIMLAARGPEALARGEFYGVLGEIIVGGHTFAQPLFLKLHPQGEAWIRARFADLGPMVAPVEAPGCALRSDHHPPVAEDLDIEVGDGLSWRARDQVFGAGELVVARAGATLVVKTRDGRRQFDIVECCDMYLQLTAGSHFSLLPKARHVPRLTIDNLVLGRESWHFSQDQLEFCRADTKHRFPAARAFAKQHGLPRFVFARVPQEQKPWFVDFASPIYLEILAKLCRKATSLSISEMLPSIEETWLPDAGGQRYAAELRIAAVDPKRWTAP
jgi:Lantibiotic dehydratase, N terminus